MVMSWQGSSSNHEVKNNFGVCTVDKVSKMKREERDKYIIQGIQTINKMVSIFFFLSLWTRQQTNRRMFEKKSNDRDNNE